MEIFFKILTIFVIFLDFLAFLCYKKTLAYNNDITIFLA